MARRGGQTGTWPRREDSRRRDAAPAEARGLDQFWARILSSTGIR